MLGPSDPVDARPVRSRDPRWAPVSVCMKIGTPSVLSASGRAQLRRRRLKSLAAPRCVRLLGGLAVPPAGLPAIVGAGVCRALGATVGEVVQDSIRKG